jgi:hypothetical protein
VKVPAAGGLDAEHAVAQLGDVQVRLEDAPLGPGQLDEHREVRLETLAHEAAAGPQEEVLRHLLGDRARPAQPAVVLVRVDGLLDRLHVEAVMVGKSLILGGDDRDGRLR